MTDTDDIRSTVLAELLRIAPEVEPEELEPATPLRDQVDLDSMDWLNFIIALHTRLQVDIPESDYAKLVTLNDVIGYLQNKLQA
ncbi:MAG: phosphopantetheine-binding protein [Burkholderiales bacterium]